jgi:hypothetical protein
MADEKGSPVPDEQFVKVYAESNSLEEVRQKLGWKSKSSVQARASKLRAAGVGLPYFIGQAKQPIDDKSLNAILQDMGRYEEPRSKTKPKTGSRKRG